VRLSKILEARIAQSRKGIFIEVSQGSDIQKQVDATLATEGDRLISIYAAPVVAESGDETAILLHLVETTEQKMLEARFTQSQ
tara:strand:- start:437 stop:685 length:249 start_codon:yes stop_codon:yes gene_type:complete